MKRRGDAKQMAAKHAHNKRITDFKYGDLREKNYKSRNSSVGEVCDQNAHVQNFILDRYNYSRSISEFSNFSTICPRQTKSTPFWGLN